MFLATKIAFEEIGSCHISRYIVKNLFTNLTAKKISELTKLPLTTVNYYRKTKTCIGDIKTITGYVYVNFNHLHHINQIYPTFNLVHYCVLSMLNSHRFEISGDYIKQKLNLPRTSNVIAETRAFEIDWKATAKESKKINIIL